MEIRLSIAGEKRLRDSLIETLINQKNELEAACQSSNIVTIKEIGHSFKGNSGAAYFQLTEVKEIGLKLELIAELSEQEFDRLLQQLEDLINQLKSISEN